MHPVMVLASNGERDEISLASREIEEAEREKSAVSGSIRWVDIRTVNDRLLR
jgi:hypothetical protein